ncbi:MAG: hypothetical protein DSO07_08535 [Thermoproteota archaeon]|uniref:Uncharacterized protein n=1 Tax=Candidatus Methanodesulfokora washburnensis TaxID=2478471 RepID=A0A429GF42_9CREN|nr:hypothetical protein [Candidatus Methanodesulfokores washburnensis]RSN72497.1 hypothetical protein D6D85_13590 [Candidatus Methanodesulfokores washburnensis]RZN62732.1 MAG: hypothetical protein EF810_02075 [Candidatus Methanodesulfokores washburnensis]TDA40676.1 MAG: hypothetical protein DSO07_08535 [Candidatus Korarchaeota archaeon]
MEIKHPESDNARRVISRILSEAKRHINRTSPEDNLLTLIYASSYIITTASSLVAELTSVAEKGAICIVRTMAPSAFGGAIGELQRKAVDELRRKCYVALHGKKGREITLYNFINHAKFLLYYHICSDGYIYRQKFYGSTNFTVRGLARSDQLGNYEEFYCSRLERRPELTSRDMYFIKEAIDTLEHKNKLYTDPQYLQQYTSAHLQKMREKLESIRSKALGTTLGELFQLYVESSLLYFSSLAFLEDIPGKRITMGILKELPKPESLLDIFELEVLAPTGEKEAESIAEILGLEKEDIRKRIEELTNNIEFCYGMIRKYIYSIKEIHEAKELGKILDSIEQEFLSV